MRRPRFQFGVRTLLVVVTLAAVVLGYHARWMHQRDAFTARDDVFAFAEIGGAQCRAPALLWLLGERGVVHITVENADLKALARELFPEAKSIQSIDDWPVSDMVLPPAIRPTFRDGPGP